MTQGGMDKEEDWSRPAQPKSSNTQLDECTKCQQLRRRGVDRDLVVTRKATKKRNSLSVRALHVYCLKLWVICTLPIPTSVDCLHQV